MPGRGHYCRGQCIDLAAEVSLLFRTVGRHAAIQTHNICPFGTCLKCCAEDVVTGRSSPGFVLNDESAVPLPSSENNSDPSLAWGRLRSAKRYSCKTRAKARFTPGQDVPRPIQIGKMIQQLSNMKSPTGSEPLKRLQGQP